MLVDFKVKSLSDWVCEATKVGSTFRLTVIEPSALYVCCKGVESSRIAFIVLEVESRPDKLIRS